MKRLNWLLTFIVIVIFYFIGMVFQNNTLQFITKPLLISSLLAYFITTTSGNISFTKKWIIGALTASIAGDTLLLFANKNELFFILGLAAFLIAHIFYIICFHLIKVKAQIAGKWYVAVIVAIYYFFIMSLLLPYLGSLKIPVLLYGFAISFMLLIAMHLYELPDNKTGRYILTGAVLFVVSDSALAINKFYHAFAWGGWVIMVTYITAQYLITRGLIRYINPSQYARPNT